MQNQLQQLSSMTRVVADTGDIEAIAKFQPEDATTNPSLVLKAAQSGKYQPLLEQAVATAQGMNLASDEQLSWCADLLGVNIGKEILKLIPGRISTEVDARLSFDTDATINRAHRLIDLYEQAGIGRDRVLIKIASTWEGIRAAEQLEKAGIQCNLTLLFSFAQAQACADAGAYLISPFVGRILDWYKKSTGVDHYAPEEDPGVLSVSRIFNYYKGHNYNTVVMGASFRNLDEIRQLAGCDRLTISPNLLEELEQCTDTLPQRLFSNQPHSDEAAEKLSEAAFRWEHNEDAMAVEKLADGIRNFTRDQEQLEEQLAKIAKL